MFLSLFSAKILLFYVIFYAALAGFFAAIFAVFYQTLDDQKPKWQQDNGLIGSNPGLGFRPMPPESNVESTLVWFEAANEKNTEHWIGALNEFLASKKREKIFSGDCITIFFIILKSTRIRRTKMLRRIALTVITRTHRWMERFVA